LPKAKNQNKKNTNIYKAEKYYKHDKPKTEKKVIIIFEYS